jgi:hypothetical protein
MRPALLSLHTALSLILWTLPFFLPWYIYLPLLLIVVAGIKRMHGVFSVLLKGASSQRKVVVR